MKRALILAGMLLAMPGTGLAAPKGEACFAPPATPQRMTRTLIRYLSDGNRILVKRSYDVRFMPRKDGYRVEGAQVAVEVSTPPRLSALADLERKRVESDVLPMLLDRQGNLLAAAEAPRKPMPEMSAAADTVIARSSLTPAEQAAAKAFAHALIAPGPHAETAWPDNLFNAQPGTREAVLHPALPDGSSGEVALTLTARREGCAPVSGFERDIVTKLGATARHSSEIWTLENAAESPVPPAVSGH